MPQRNSCFFTCLFLTVWLEVYQIFYLLWTLAFSFIDFLCLPFSTSFISMVIFFHYFSAYFRFSIFLVKCNLNDFGLFFFLLYAFNIINFPTAKVLFKLYLPFWHSVVLFSFSSRYFLILLLYCLVSKYLVFCFFFKMLF